MNINQAKTQIIHTVKAYLRKNKFDEYTISSEKQRPIFLLGTPGIGKTAIMKQISQELHIGFVSYSMTHHTRQSALGLPYIAEKNYHGKNYKISEYTMSEIIASVYEKIEETGLQEGILFLDEINCVSETLAPAMLQFLQYKIFGQHKLPEGWIVATAGNPPEFNHAVREFDIATLDRLKVILVEADYATWRNYAISARLHHSIITYLDLKKENFYMVETTVDGKQIVTPRAWEDLSDMMQISEELGLPLDEDTFSQYLQYPPTAKDFSIFYEIYKKYEDKYEIQKIFLGEWRESFVTLAKTAPFEERISFVNIVFDILIKEIQASNIQADILKLLYEQYLLLKNEKEDIAIKLQANHKTLAKSYEMKKKTDLLTKREQEVLYFALEDMEKTIRILENSDIPSFALIRDFFNEKNGAFEQKTKDIGNMLTNAFTFMETAYGDNNEILILVSSLTGNQDSVHFISQFGCDKYFEHSKNMLLYERQQDITNKLQGILL